jgi:glycosyltransferase involved in cell wall biosynthesis
MKILHVTCSMDPALGGLSACVQSLVPALATLGHPSEIVSLDRPGESFLASLPVPVHALGPARMGYAYASRLGPWLKAGLPRFDAVIVHGLWQYHGLAVHRALARRDSPSRFIFSHGMLDPWFKRRYPLKHIKKWFYWWLAERRILRGAAAVLFTCEEERRLARQSFAGSSYRERVVAFGTAAPPGDPALQREAFLLRHPELRDRPYWLFLGRIHPKKGADLLIEAYTALAAQGAELPCLVMAGPCADPEYLRTLQLRAAAVGPAGAVLWPGMLTGDVKWGALRAAEVFVLPSHQENFGIAVVEALACGTPVLISDQVNIWREIAGDDAGLVEPDTAAGTLRLLVRWQALGAGTRRAMRAAARRGFFQRYEIGAVAHSLVAALEAAPPGRPSS